ncbi:hypothetical protein ACFQ9R_03805 [Nocardia sp. NPDC056541]|uniref:hypothetical protein n=1 Tax=Nocardia sp. NPDC056541 TaxID=3345860 RepID=UPI00366D25C1
MIGALGGGLTMQGDTPFATCFLQALANILGKRGVAEPLSALGPALGFGRRSATRLTGGERTVANTARVTGLSLNSHHHTDWSDAIRFEREILAAAGDLIVGLDSFDIPSPYENLEHLTHAVVVLEHHDDYVVVADAMNHPQPRRMNLAAYAASRMSEAGAGVSIVCSGLAGRPADQAEIIELLATEVAAHRGELGIAAAFAVDVEAGDGVADVADVAAERLVLGQLVGGLDRSWAPDVAKALAGLSRRWYLAHTMAREIASGNAAPRPARLARLLTELHGRETAFNAMLTDYLAADRIRT